MLEELTPEHESILDQVVEEYCAFPLAEPNMEAIRRWTDLVYGLYDQPPRAVEICPSPFAALKRCEELTGAKASAPDNCGVSESGWIAEYDAYHRIGELSDDDVSALLTFKAFIRCAWDTIMLDELALVIRHPTKLARDADGYLHCNDGPAVAWEDGREDYAWHGEWVPKRVIMEPKSYTPDEYRDLGPEPRRALAEHVGHEHVVKMLGAEPVDRWTDPYTGLQYELLRAADQQWLRKQSPVLQDGSQPHYLEPVHEDLSTAAGARKWQATDWDPSRCDDDPELIYGVET